MILAGLALLAAGCSPTQSPSDSRVAAIADRLAIDQLVAGDYPRALDAKNWESYADKFTDDGELSLLGQTAKGRQGIIGMLKALPPDERLLHVISNLSYAIDGDEASGGAYWQDTGMVNGAPAVAAAGRYEDALRKVNGQWKFAKRSIIVDFMQAQTPPPAAATSSN
jgi:ketosteroid isomerase-like protein